MPLGLNLGMGAPVVGAVHKQNGEEEAVLPRQESQGITETSDGKQLVLSRGILEAYVQERIKYDRMKIFSCLTVQLRRDLEAQLKAAQDRTVGLPGVTGVQKHYKLELRHR